MLRSPLFPIPTDDITPSDFLRNYSCLYYDVCLDEAADQNLLLDCSICMYKDMRAWNYIFTSNLP
jgi:hypothetical protein